MGTSTHNPVAPLLLIGAVILGLQGTPAHASPTALPVPPPTCDPNLKGTRDQQPGHVEALFKAGCFMEAMALGERLGAAPELAAAQRAGTLALAARAGLAAAMVDPLNAKAPSWIDEAEGLAARAVETDADSVEGHLQRAIALGLQARASDPVEALRGGYAEKAREHIDLALGLAPDEPYAIAVDGAWHLEVVMGAGGFAASMMFGADAEDGLARFEEARRAPGASLMIDVQYAVAALVYSPRQTGEAARAALADALAKPAPLAIEQFHRALAEVLLERLKAGAADSDIKALAATIQGRQS